MSSVTADLPLAAESSAPPAPATQSGLFLRVLKVAGSASGWLFGVASLFVGMAVLASVPLGGFLVLGYLLEASGRVSRSVRLRDGFVGVRTAAKLGGVALGAVLLWLPLYGLSILAENAAIIDPGGRIASHWQ